jgi:hypothetical protein
MNHFKSFCPFIYKNSRNEVIQVNTFYPTHGNKVTIINSDNTSQDICVTKLYFIDGYNKENSFLSHISSKYNYKM